MAVDLNELFDSALDAGAHELADASPAEGAVAGWVRRVRRRRAVRHSVQVAAAVPIVAAVGAALWFGAGALSREAPVATPTPTPAPAQPSPSSDPTPTSEETVEPTPSLTTTPPPEPIEVPGLPPYLESPDDVLSLAGPGWVLAAYQVGDESRGEVLAVPRTVFLVSPDGARYRVVDVPEVELLTLHHWDAGEPRVRVTYGSYADRFADGLTTGWLDLSTGELSPDGDQLTWASFMGLAVGGDEVWWDGIETRVVLVAPDGSRRTIAVQGGGQSAVLDPAGMHLAVQSEDGDTGFLLVDLEAESARLVEYGVAGKICTFTGWLDDASLLAQCMVDDEGSANRFTDRTEHRVSVVDEQSTRELGAELGGREVYFGGTHVRDQGVLVEFRDRAKLEAEPGLEACAPSMALWIDGRVVDVPAFGPGGRQSVGTVASYDGAVYVGSEYACTFGEDPPSGELARFDPTTGSVATLLPAIEYGNDLDGGRFRSGLVSSWVVAH